MSKDKYQSKRAYKVRGAFTKRRRKQATSGSGKKSTPGHTFITTCPECPRTAEGTSVAVDANTRLASCKHGHTWEVI